MHRACFLRLEFKNWRPVPDNEKMSEAISRYQGTIKEHDVMCLENVHKTLFSRQDVKSVFEECRANMRLQHSVMLYSDVTCGHYIIAICSSAQQLKAVKPRSSREKILLRNLIDNGLYDKGELQLATSYLENELKDCRLLHQDYFIEEFYEGTIQSEEEEEEEALRETGYPLEPTSNEQEPEALTDMPPTVPSDNESATLAPLSSETAVDASALGMPTNLTMPKNFASCIQLGVTTVLKEFPPHGLFQGIITGRDVVRKHSRSKCIWTVTWSDSDVEDLWTWEVFKYSQEVEKQHLVTEPKNMKSFLEAHNSSPAAHLEVSTTPAAPPMHTNAPNSLPPPTKKRTGRVDSSVHFAESLDIAEHLQQHILVPINKALESISPYCVLGINCIEAQNDDNLCKYVGVGTGRSLVKSNGKSPRAGYFCSGCTNEKGAKLAMCKMCFMMYHSMNKVWVLGPNTRAVPKHINTKTRGIVDILPMSATQFMQV